MSSETYQKFQESGNPMYKYSLSRMVVLENKRTGKMYSFIMSIAGDREYLEGKNFKILENGYLKKEQDFSGFVLFHELTGEFTNGWVYCDGKITNTIVEADKLGVNLNLKQATIHYYVWVETCNVYLYMTSVDGIIQKIEATEGHCTSEMISAGSYTIGSEMPTSGGSGEYGPAVIEAGEACGCTICPVCGGCMVDDALKVAQLPGDDTPPPTFFDCEVCSCPTLSNPCDQVQSLGNSSAFQSKMQVLKSKTTENYEAAYIMRNGDYQYMQGSDSMLTMTLTISSANPIDGYFHSHPQGGLSVFSASDIRAIYEAYIKLGIKDIETFTAGVVTASGTTYLLKVEDKAAFINFGSANLKYQNDFDEFESDMSDLVKPDNPEWAQEKGLLDAIKGTGLTLHKGDISSFSQWNLRVLTSSGLPTNSNCNN